MAQRFDRTEKLIGRVAVEKLENSRVAVFGVGGVGSFVCEALARGGVGNLDLFDSDTVDITNINRQLIALDSTVGKYKTDVMRDRIVDINPNARVLSNKVYITADSARSIDFSKYDYIVDAVDNVTAKIALCEGACKNSVPIISAMGAGNRLDSRHFEIADIEKTSGCPLAKVMRVELRKRNIKGVKAAFSKQPCLKQGGTDNADGAVRPAPASISFVPSAMGLLIAGEVICDLIKNTDEEKLL